MFVSNEIISFHRFRAVKIILWLTAVKKVIKVNDLKFRNFDFLKNFFLKFQQTEFLDNEVTRLNEKVRKYGLIADNDVIPNF